MENQLKETHQSTTSCSRRNIGGSGNGNSNDNGNGNGGGCGSGDDDDNGGGSWVMGRRVWGRCQVADGAGGNGNNTELGTMWV